MDGAFEKLNAQLQDPELRLKLRMMLPGIISKINFNAKGRSLEIFDLNRKSIYTTYAA